MTKVWRELRRFLKRSYRNQRTARKFELRRRLEQVLLTDQTNYGGYSYGCKDIYS